MEDFQPVGRSVKGNGFPPKTSVLMLKYRQFIESSLGEKGREIPKSIESSVLIFSQQIYLSCFYVVLRKPFW